MVGVFHMNLGATFVLRQETQQAYHHLHQSRRQYDQVQSKDFLAETLRYLAEAALLDGDLTQATAWATEGIQVADELEMAAEAACCWCVLGQIALAQDDGATAVTHMRQSVNLLDTLSDEYQLARSRYWLARALLVTGKTAEARQLLAQAQTTFSHLDAVLDETAVQTLQKSHNFT
jgi:tetratricopeptide (TPR) repeat protein